MRTNAQRGPIGTWLVQGRRTRGWGAEEAIARILEATGHRVSKTHLSNLETGNRRQLSPDLEAAFEAVYGPAPKGAVERRLSPEERMKVAMKEAIMELVEEGQLDVYLRSRPVRPRRNVTPEVNLTVVPTLWGEPEQDPAA